MFEKTLDTILNDAFMTKNRAPTLFCVWTSQSSVDMNTSHKRNCWDNVPTQDVSSDEGGFLF